MSFEATNGVKTDDINSKLAGFTMNGIALPTEAEQSEHKPTWVVHVEVRLKPTSAALVDSIRRQVHTYITGWAAALYLPSVVTGWQSQPTLSQNVDQIRVTESTYPGSTLAIEQAELDIHVYQPNDSDIEEFDTSLGGGKSEDEATAATICELPCKSWDGLWDTLIYPDDIKPRLLNYIHATLLFSDRNVDFNVISWNRVVLLHGPPGTGKTSLCRALAQKLSIRLSDRYPACKMVEINSHSLFSRWFSESGKLVQKLFANVTEMIEEDGSFVVLLMDEVESLTAARAGAMSGNEPTDALRVVNALLTQLDKLKHRKNVLVMTTSNLVDAIDTAFVDRADVVQYVGLPAQEGIYWILQSCISELVRAGIIAPVELRDPLSLRMASSEGALDLEPSRRLWDLAGLCQGMSGRSLRRLPVLAHARHIGTAAIGGKASDVRTWLDAMARVVAEEKSGRAFVLNNSV